MEKGMSGRVRAEERRGRERIRARAPRFCFN